MIQHAGASTKLSLFCTNESWCPNGAKVNCGKARQYEGASDPQVADLAHQDCDSEQDTIVSSQEYENIYTFPRPPAKYVIKMVSSLVVSSLVVLLLTTSLLTVAFVTSHWLRIGRLNRSKLCSCTRCDCGIWYSCADDSLLAGVAPQLTESSGGCEWFLSSSFSRDSLPDWFKATQAMVTIALVTSMGSLLVGLCSICAPYNLHRIVTIATTCTAVLLTVSVSVFGAMVSHLDEIFIEGYDHLPYLSWSYWLAVAATLVAWLTAICFFFVCRLKCSLYTV